MTIKQFHKLTDEWPVSKHFKKRMIYAIREGMEAEFVTLTDTDRRWLDVHGFNLNDNKVKV